MFKIEGWTECNTAFDVIITLVSHVLNPNLTRPIIGDEVKEVIFKLGISKASCSNNFLFLPTAPGSSRVKAIIVVKSFCDANTLDPLLGQKDIILIPKVLNFISPQQFYPISLCNFRNKIISKVLTNNLKGYLSDLITPFKSAFVEGSLIQYNMILAHEVFHDLRKKNGMAGKNA